MTDAPLSPPDGLGTWQPIETAPRRQVVWVRNENMDRPVKATRGFALNGTVHPNDTFFTSVFTPDDFYPFPAGRLVYPTEWRPESQSQRSDESEA